MIRFDTNYKNTFGRPKFSGMASLAPKVPIYDYADAIKQWKILKHPQYTNIFHMEEQASKFDLTANKSIHEQNYAFLDKLVSRYDKIKFIEYFRNFTGFPDLKKISENIINEFKRVIEKSNKEMNSSRGSNCDKILLSGYDEFCSTALMHSLPGSDLDKGYAIVKGPDSMDFEEQRCFSNILKGKIWDDIDNRILSVNHEAAFPNILTDKELSLLIHKMDYYVANEMELDKDDARFFAFQRLIDGNRITGAKFNIFLSQNINDIDDKYEAKNLAYVVEPIRDFAHLHRDMEYVENEFFELFNNSPFCWYSNVSQNRPMHESYQSRTIKFKPKLIARESMEKEFDKLSIDNQYDLIKDVIRSMSGDNKDPRFENLFYSSPDNKLLLLNDILRGNTNIYFERGMDGVEKIYTFPNKK